MKKIFTLIGLVVFSINANAQLQNLDFENWDFPIGSQQNRPTGWTWTNLYTHSLATLFYFPPQTDAQSNDYAIKLSVWYNYTKDCALQTTAINSRPSQLKGYYKYVDNVIYDDSGPVADTAQVSVYLTKMNPVTFQKDTIGSGIVNLLASGDYSEFIADIVYTNDQTPDAISVLLDPSILTRQWGFWMPNTGITSFFTVDNLSLVDNSLEVENRKPTTDFKVYPNPATDQINFDDSSGDAVIIDVTGRIVGKTNLQNTNAINVSGLNPGTYLIQIRNEKGHHTSKFIKA